MGQCEWPVMAPSERVDRKTLMMGISPLSASAYADDPDPAPGRPRCASSSNRRRTRRSIRPTAATPRSTSPAAGLRVGYVSSDLRDHAIGYLMAELFELHDRDQVEVFAYYCGRKDEGALNARIRAGGRALDRHPRDERRRGRRSGSPPTGSTSWSTSTATPATAAPAVFARRPAPILVNWLGYPGTMGTPYHHYVIADDCIIPPGCEHYYTEKVVRLPCYQPNDRKRAVAAAPRRPARRPACRRTPSSSAASTACRS